MNIRVYIDPGTGEPHIYNHEVDEEEVEDVLKNPVEDQLGPRGSRVTIGQTSAGRYLQVIYIPDPAPHNVMRCKLDH